MRKKAYISTPKMTGIKVLKDFSVSEIIPFINWVFFFHEWKFKGSYPALLNDPEKGEEAMKLLADAKQLLEKMCKEKMIRANAVVGIFPAGSVKNNVEITIDNKYKEVIVFERNRELKNDKEPNLCLADFIAPTELNAADHIGMYALTTGIGIEKWEEEFKKSGDDYSAIMLKILSNRLAEAFAELLHQKIRKEIWGYSPDENLTPDELFKEKYHGIRPAPGYPACPDHKLKEKIFSILDAEKNTGIKLTENYSMLPSASVCGFYFAHPESRYFGV